MSEQLDIFEENKITVLEEEVKRTKELSEKTHNTSENVRRGIFARLSNLEKILLEKYLQQEQRINTLEEMVKGR